MGKQWTPAAGLDPLEGLHRQPSWIPPAAPLVVVAPHPGDETLVAGALMASMVGLNRAVMVVSVSDGESAHPGWDGLRALRQRELRRALDVLGAGAILTARIGLPDREIHHHEPYLLNYLRRVVPKGATLVGPHEQDGHPDHEAVGRMCVALAEEQGHVLARYPFWAWQRPAPLQPCGWARFDAGLALLSVKQRAMACFGSQLRPPFREPVYSASFLSYFTRPFEAFTL